MNYHKEDKYPLLAHSNLLKSASAKIIKRLFTKIYLKQTIFITIFVLFICIYIIYQTSLLIFPRFRPYSSDMPYLINTSTCQIKDWPLFDKEIWPLYKNLQNVDFGCDKNAPLLKIERVNFTWIHIAYPEAGGWLCNATELAREKSIDGLTLGPTVINLEAYTNFDKNQMTEKLKDGNQFKWDSIKVNCKSSDNTAAKYSRVVPLIQHYQAKKANANPKVNIILLGIDSVSRLNFLRHMHQTKSFFDAQGFIPLLGYHKVGENSFPNIVPMLTGHLSTYYYNDSKSSQSSKFNNVNMIFKNAQKIGYLTTFIEDMPPYGLFTVRGGLKGEQPTDYYLRPTNLAIWDELYYTYSCYQDRLEHELYWDYLLDLFEAFHLRSNQAHLTLAHMSTLTHNYFNHAGYADKPFASFLSRLFRAGHHQNSVIMVYSDHALRFGDAANTTSNVHEQRLPFFYIYIPDSLTLNGLKADQLRAILQTNQHRLTSHLDVHATMLHILTNIGTRKNDDLLGQSFLTVIPSNRSCSSAGIPPQYCLCNGYEPIVPLTEEMKKQSEEVVLHINQLMAAHGNYCVPLIAEATYRAFDSGLHSLTGRNVRYRLLHFSTRPNNAIFEAILSLDSDENMGKTIKIENISRLTRYDGESNCVTSKLDIVQFCLCWDKIK